MIQQQLDAISNFIKLHNPYFDKGFSFVEQSDKNGYVHNGSEVIFPNDTFGDYFYIRVPSRLGFAYDLANGDGRNTFGVSTPLVIVAVMKDADPYKLALNLISTIGKMCDIGKQFTAILIHSEDVLLQELAKAADAEQDKALRNIQQGYTYVSVNFTMTYTQPYIALNCITKPCKICS